MHIETARDRFESGRINAGSIFSGLKGYTDAVYSDAGKNCVICSDGLPFEAPVSGNLLNNQVVNEYVCSLGKTNILFSFENGNVTIYSGGKKLNAPKIVLKEAEKVYEYTIYSPGYIGKHGEHVIDLKAGKVGTHFDVNLLIGNRCGFPSPMLTTPKGALDSFGRGSFRAGASRQVTSTLFNLHPEQNGEPSNRQVYICENGKQIFCSLDVNTNVKTATCRHYSNYSEFEYVTEDWLTITRTIFILPSEAGMPDAVETQRVTIVNNTDKDRKLSVVFTGMFGLASPESAMNDIIYASVTWQGGVAYDKNKVIAVTPKPYPGYLKTQKRFAMVVSDGEHLDSYCTNYEEFVGNGNIEHPENVAFLPSSLTMKIAPFFAVNKNVSVPSNGKATVEEYTGYSFVSNGDDKPFLDSLSKFSKKYVKSSSFDLAFKAVKDFSKKYSDFLQIRTGDEDYDKYVNNNLPFQVYYQSFISRSFAWTQKAFREIGFREIQDLFASMYYMIGMGKADLVKAMLVQWVENVYPMGYANHNFYSTGKEPGDCSDDALWLIQGVYRYVTLSSDIAFLDEEYKMAGTEEKRAVVDTLNEILQYSVRISVGKNGLPLLDKADWNDTLRLNPDWVNGPEKEKRYIEQLKASGKEYGAPYESDDAESVMNAFLVKLAMDDMSVLYKMKRKGQLSGSYTRIAESYANIIRLSSWKEDFYARALINSSDRYSYLGGKGDGLSADPNIDGTYWLNSFSWSVLSGVANEYQISRMVDSIEKYLKKDSGIKLCSPSDLGRIKGEATSSPYFPGDRENGGVFKHAEMMGTAAMIKAAKIVKDKKLSERLLALADFAFDTVLPYKTLEHPYKTKGNPRFCTQYINAQTGENIGPMLSGTASWLMLSIIEQIGFSPMGNKIEFNPILKNDQKELNYCIDLDGTKYSVRVKSKKGEKRVTSGSVFTCDGVPFNGTINKFKDKKNHRIVITL